MHQELDKELDILAEEILSTFDDKNYTDTVIGANIEKFVAYFGGEITHKHPGNLPPYAYSGLTAEHIKNDTLYSIYVQSSFTKSSQTVEIVTILSQLILETNLLECLMEPDRDFNIRLPGDRNYKLLACELARKLLMPKDFFVKTIKESVSLNGTIPMKKIADTFAVPVDIAIVRARDLDLII